MTPSEIADAYNEGLIGDFEGIVVDMAEERNGVLVVGEYAALPVGTISTVLSRTNDIEITDESNGALATLCFTKHLGEVDRSELTRYQFVAFLADAEPAACHHGRYSFRRDYLIVEKARLTEYLAEYKDTAPIWGRFSHTEIAALDTPITLTTTQALTGLQLPTTYHQEAFGRYLMATNPLERYLRLYQSVELLFDYVIFKRMQALNDDLIGFSGLLSEHGKTELDRLKAIMRAYCSNHQRLASKMEMSSGFPREREDLFQLHSKSGNPLLEQMKWTKVVTAMDGASFNEAELITVSAIDKKPGAFRALVIDIAAYWIYRIRSSIAHNRVGEFLLQDAHAQFVSNFAEPLMLETVSQIFANPDFNALAVK